MTKITISLVFGRSRWYRFCTSHPAKFQFCAEVEPICNKGSALQVFRIPFGAMNCLFSFVGCSSFKGLLCKAALLGRRGKLFYRQDTKLGDSGRIISHTASLKKQILGFQYSENHWRGGRFGASSIRALKSVSQVGGPEVKLINISRRGALIEGPERMSLRSRISLRLTTAEEVYFLKGRIIRCRSFPIDARAIKYQSAIIFDESFTILPELLI